MKTRYTLVQGKNFADSIRLTKEFIKEGIEKSTPYKVKVYSCKFPRKLKKVMKKLGSWEFEVKYVPNVTVSLTDETEVKLEQYQSLVGYLV